LRDEFHTSDVVDKPVAVGGWQKIARDRKNAGATYLVSAGRLSLYTRRIEM
jgi:hypothetical protein